jgi:hypothetical protein
LSFLADPPTVASIFLVTVTKAPQAPNGITTGARTVSLRQREQNGACMVMGCGSLLLELTPAFMMAMGWTRLFLIREKTSRVGIVAMIFLLHFEFEFQKVAGKDLAESEMSKEKPPNLILFLSSGGKDFLIGKG